MVQHHLCCAVCIQLGLTGADGRNSISVDDSVSAAYGIFHFAVMEMMHGG